ncbi:MAG: cyclic nucleotide-binding domain-containing protein, partial [Acetobacteraceae bacterium]
MLEANLQANRLLAALPGETHARLRPKLKPVTLKFGEVLYRSGKPLRYVYFPLDAVIAKIHLTADGDSASLGVIGHEGLVGIASFLGGHDTVTETRVIAEGAALRL